MAAVAALLESRTAVAALRRTLPRGGPGLVELPRFRRACGGSSKAGWWTPSCSPSTPALLPDLAELRRQLPGVPVVAYAPFRPDDGELLLACRKHAVPVAVEGVDDAVVGEMVIRASVTAERRRALADAPRMLRLTEPLQRSAWSVLLGEVERPVRTSDARAAPGREPGASLPAVRRRGRAQSQAGDRPHPDRLRRPAAGEPRLLDSHRGPAAPLRLVEPSERHGAPDRRTCPPAGWAGWGRGGCCRRLPGGTRGAGCRSSLSSEERSDEGSSHPVPMAARRSLASLGMTASPVRPCHPTPPPTILAHHPSLARNPICDYFHKLSRESVPFSQGIRTHGH